jgi:hypothetical protein
MSPCYALRFGDETTGRAFANDIDGLCPRDLNLSVFSKRILMADGDVPPDLPGVWDVALVPEEILQSRPDAVPTGPALITDALSSLGYGQILAILHPS